MSRLIIDKLGSAYAAMVQMEPLAPDANEDEIENQREVLSKIHQYCGQMTALANGLFIASSNEAEATLDDGSGQWGKSGVQRVTPADRSRSPDDLAEFGLNDEEQVLPEKPSTKEVSPPKMISIVKCDDVRQDPNVRFMRLLKEFEETGCEPINILDDWRVLWMEGKGKKMNSEDEALVRLLRGYWLYTEDEIVSIGRAYASMGLTGWIQMESEVFEGRIPKDNSWAKMCNEEREICENRNVEERIATREGVSGSLNTLLSPDSPAAPTGSSIRERYCSVYRFRDRDRRSSSVFDRLGFKVRSERWESMEDDLHQAVVRCSDGRRDGTDQYEFRRRSSTKKIDFAVQKVQREV